MHKPRPTRTYDATHRRRRTAERQELALAAARRLFAERGYRETTMEAIAAEAGMATPTLYAAFGSKHGILSRLLDRLVSGEPGGPSVLATADARAVFAEPDRHRALRKFAHHMDAIQDRLGPIYEIMKDAARSEPDVARLYGRAQNNRFGNLEALAARLAEREPLRNGLSVEDAGRTVWVLASPEVRHMLLVHAGWTRARYEAWLGDTLCAALLLPPRRKKKPAA
jgi:AcrR family transcriptional regulator